MPHFVCRLVPPRPSFPFDMTEQEREVMGAHFEYLRAKGAEAGSGIVLYGPVADPEGAYGLMIVEAADADAVEAVTGPDPAVRAGIGLSYEILPMMSVAFGRAGT